MGSAAFPRPLSPDPLVCHQTTSVRQRSPPALAPTQRERSAHLGRPESRRADTEKRGWECDSSRGRRRSRAGTVRWEPGRLTPPDIPKEKASPGLANATGNATSIIRSDQMLGIPLPPFPSFVRSSVLGAWDFQIELREIRTLSPVQ